MAVYILIHSPLYHKDPKWYKSILNIEIPENFKVDYFFSYYHEVPPKLNKDGDYDPTPLNVNLPVKMNRAREIALNGKYDAILNVEDDTIVPKTVLEDLWNAPFDVSGALYRLRKIKYYNTPICARPINETRWLNDHEAKTLEYVECSLVAFGCTLIHRRVFEKIPFYMDGQYCNELKKEGFKMGVVTKCRCGHVDRNGDIMWVFPEDKEQFRWLL